MGRESVIDIRQWAKRLSLSPEGLWVGSRPSSISYPSEGNHYYLQIEEKSFWFRHRNNCLLKVLRCFPPGEFLLDIGGGNGFVSIFLNKNGIPTVLVEPGL